MNKLALNAIVFSHIIALAACSNSRGGDTADTSRYLVVNPATNTTQNNTATDNSATNNTTNSTTNNSVDTGNFFSAPVFVTPQTGSLVGAIIKVNADGTTTSTNPINDGIENLNELVIDNTRIGLFNVNDLIYGNGKDTFKSLTAKDISPNTPFNGSVAGYVGGWGLTDPSPDYFRHLRFGVVALNGQDHLFVQGQQTPLTTTQSSSGEMHYKMPTSGRFLYQKGLALYGKGNEYQQLAAEVEANFADKTVKVVLKENNAEKLAFSATIDGNRFSGTSNGVQSQGAFYGSLAREVGGVFQQTEGEDKGKNGVFGATQKTSLR